MMRRYPVNCLYPNRAWIARVRGENIRSAGSIAKRRIRDLLDFLDVSKPRVYDGLRKLEESGLMC